ncbi:short-chain dehydrogenase [Mucilaginibacter sp. PPCGB 2223]|uniref:SDR family oxidoreductase n=1 Tax=Mucilaginibacter sp. PPCGB 2223 TaxID=1886027 RepID=UPI0008265E54|nr:SDR family oxidoreductase [Mucilaginibacter sp. PPCGB 2223]OCX52924.1 short-chain dehydrogenase [Mucilaginibacter sp. PPCGB 2223]
MNNLIITGASKGMGREIAKAFALQGLNMALCSRSYTELLKLQKELQAINPGIRVLIRQADASNKDELLAFAGYAEQELGFISVIVNNVGMYEPSSILDDEEDTFQKLINTNLMPAYELYRYFGKTMMAEGRGHIFAISSVAALNPVVQAGTYTVTKFALRGLTDVMRLEMQPYNVKVTCILPGSTLTDSWSGTDVSADKFVLPQDIASAIVCAYNMSPGANVDEIVMRPVSGQL